MKQAILVFICMLLAGCALLKVNEEAEQQAAHRVSPQAAHLQ